MHTTVDSHYDKGNMRTNPADCTPGKPTIPHILLLFIYYFVTSDIRP